MLKLTAAISKRSDWTRDEWLAHYKERHASLSASVGNFTRHGIRYVQNYALHSPEIPDFPESNTGRVAVTELWFDTVEKLRAAYAEPDYMKYLRTDELRFCDFSDLAAGVGTEIELHDSRSSSGDKRYANLPRAKIFAFRTERAGLDRVEFQTAWNSERAPSLMSSSNFGRFVRRYVQTHMLDVDVGIPGGVKHALIDEFWFDSTSDAVAFWTAYRSSVTDIKIDAAYLRPNSAWIIVAHEHEVFGPLPS